MNVKNKVKSLTRNANTEEQNLYEVAFAELVSYLEEFRTEDAVKPVFTLSYLVNMFKARLVQLGVVIESRIHSTGLKMKLLSVFVSVLTIKDTISLLKKGMEL